MKINLLLSILFLLMSKNILNGQNQLAPCPSSPNCVSTQAEQKRKRLPPLPFSGDLQQTKKELILLLEKRPRVTLEKDEGKMLHYTFVTKTGKFTDDVTFLFEEEEKRIHFRSASRVGWYDFGANRRRMKKLSKEWLADLGKE